MGENKDCVKIIPLGGFDKIGMNMTLIETKDNIIVIDCGTSFPPNNMPGIATSIPDVTYLKNNINKLKGIILTHGHEDHIGALPYIIGDLKVPIYGTPLTIELVEDKFREFGISGVKTKAIKLGNTIVVGDFKIEFIRTNHSIPDSAMLAIYTREGIIVHTGDFKIDMAPIIGDTVDLARLSALGTKGVLAVLSDSTNAMRKGISKSEQEVRDQLDTFFHIYKENRLIIVTFASNMDRVQQIIKLGEKYDRKVALEGSTMLEVFSAARKIGYLNFPEDTLVDVRDIDKYDDDQIIFLTTGNHGEPVQCIAGIASGNNDRMRIKKNDVVLFSSIAIHGNEVDFNKTLNSLEEQGAVVEFQDIHATGHACAGELKLLYTLLNPKFVIPAHGEYRYRREAKRIAASIGIPSENILLIQNGDIVELSSEECKVNGHISLNDILIDGFEKKKINLKVMEERKRLSQSGVIILEICIDKKTGRYASDLSITSRGFSEQQVNSENIQKLKAVVLNKLSSFVSQGVKDERVSKGICRVAEDYIRQKYNKEPIVVVLITEVML